MWWFPWWWLILCQWLWDFHIQLDHNLFTSLREIGGREKCVQTTYRRAFQRSSLNLAARPAATFDGAVVRQVPWVQINTSIKTMCLLLQIGFTWIFGFGHLQDLLRGMDDGVSPSREGRCLKNSLKKQSGTGDARQLRQKQGWCASVVNSRLCLSSHCFFRFTHANSALIRSLLRFYGNNMLPSLPCFFCGVYDGP